MTQTRFIYLIHFDQPFKHAKHYIGSALRLEDRLHDHRTGGAKCARLIHAVNQAGIGWQVVRLWRGGRADERADSHDDATPTTRTGGDTPVKNTLNDLNNALFAQLERLNDEELTAEKLTDEISRAKAMTDVADKIIENASLQLDAANFLVAHGAKQGKHSRTVALMAGQEVPTPVGSDA